MSRKTTSTKSFAKTLKKTSNAQYTVRSLDNNIEGEFDTFKEASEFVREQLTNNPEDGYMLFVDKLVLIGKTHMPKPKVDIEIVVDPKE